MSAEVEILKKLDNLTKGQRVKPYPELVQIIKEALKMLNVENTTRKTEITALDSDVQSISRETQIVLFAQAEPMSF